MTSSLCPSGCPFGATIGLRHSRRSRRTLKTPAPSRPPLGGEATLPPPFLASRGQATKERFHPAPALVKAPRGPGKAGCHPHCPLSLASPRAVPNTLQALGSAASAAGGFTVTAPAQAPARGQRPQPAGQSRPLQARGRGLARTLRDKARPGTRPGEPLLKPRGLHGRTRVHELPDVSEHDFSRRHRSCSRPAKYRSPAKASRRDAVSPGPRARGNAKNRVCFPLLPPPAQCPARPVRRRGCSLRGPAPPRPASNAPNSQRHRLHVLATAEGCVSGLFSSPVLPRE